MVRTTFRPRFQNPGEFGQTVFLSLPLPTFSARKTVWFTRLTSTLVVKTHKLRVMNISAYASVVTTFTAHVHVLVVTRLHNSSYITTLTLALFKVLCIQITTLSFPLLIIILLLYSCKYLIHVHVMCVTPSLVPSLP